MDRRPLTEIGVSALVIVICAAFWFQAYKLPPGTFEPLGSGPVPLYTASIIILCCAIVIVRGIISLRRTSSLAEAFGAEFAGGQPRGAIWLLGLTVAYVAVLQMRVASFGLITFVFLAFLIWALDGFRRRTVLPALATAAIASFGSEYLFTQVFVVDLPT